MANPQNILLIGATSAIAKDVARLYAARGCALFLVARNEEHLATLEKDLLVRGAARVGTLALDLTHSDAHPDMLARAVAFLEQVDVALVCHGSLPDQQACAADFKQALHAFDTNALSVISMLGLLATRFTTQGSGTIAVITSVAGDRGRQSNYYYGAARAMVSTFLEGLRGRLLPANVHVVDIKPGFVDTPMTAQFAKGPLWSSPASIARIIVRSIDRRRHTVYAPFYWWFIMTAVKLVPAFIFKRIRF